jgi:hypothetical protein
MVKGGIEGAPVGDNQKIDDGEAATTGTIPARRPPFDAATNHTTRIAIAQMIGFKAATDEFPMKR